MESVKMRCIKVLLVEDNPGDVRLVCETLSEQEGVLYEVTCADSLAGGLERLAQERYDVLLLDLNLPDEGGLKTFHKAHARSLQTPIIVLTGLEDEATAIRAVRDGAQDYLNKGSLNDGDSLSRALLYAVERKRSWDRSHERLKGEASQP